MKKKNNLSIIILILVIIIFTVSAFYFFIRENKISDYQYTKLNFSDYLSTKDYVKVDFDVGTNFMLFKDKKDKCKAIVMPINELQAYSIKQGVDMKIDSRPTIHDILIDIFDNYNIDVMLIKITELKGGIYYANLIIKQDDKILNLDIKPSDAAAIASRKGMDIYLRKDLINNMQNICK